MQRKPIQEQEIIKLLKSHYAIESQSAQRLPLGADMDALVYRVKAKSRDYFVKIKYNNHEEIHMSIINFLHDSGLSEIIFPIATIDGKLLKRLDHFQMIVYPFIDGKNGFEQKLMKMQWVALGKALKKIHTLPIPVSIQKQLRKETFSPKWCAVVRSLYLQMEPNVLDDIITKDFKNFFKAKFDVIQRLVNSAEKLGKKIQYDSSKYVLCHSDIHAGNILIAADKSFYIVDWDDPIMAPKERDLMFIGGGVGNVWNLADEITYFYEGYGETSIDQTVLSYYRYSRIVEDIGEFLQQILIYNHSDKSTSFQHFKSMFEANGVIDIAFRMQSE